MQHTRYIRTISPIMLLAIVVILLHLLPGFDKSAIQQEFRNAFHVIGFAVVAAILCRWVAANTVLATTISQPVLLLLVFSLTTAVAGLAEFSQIVAGKNFDPADLARDIGGAVLFIGSRFLWGLGNRPAASKALQYSLRGLAAIIGGLIFAPLGFVIFVVYSVSARFPIILDFDSQWDVRFSFPIYAEITRVAASPSAVEFDRQVGEIQLLRPDWSGIRIEPVVSDWSDYQFISLSARLVNGTDNSRLSVHLSDGNHVGVRTQHSIGGVNIGEQPSTIKLALRDIVTRPTRPDLDLANIEQVYIICQGRHEGAVLFIDNIRLE